MALLSSDTAKRSRVRLLDILPRGTQGAGNETSVGSGGDTPLVIRVPSATQTVPIARLMAQPKNGAATDLFAVDASGNISVLGGVSYGFLRAQVALTAANLLAMYTTPVSILPTPGAGKALIINRLIFEMKRTATAFASGGAVNFQYHTSTSIIPHAGTIAATVLTGAGAGTTLTILDDLGGTNGLAVPANEGIDITNASGAFTTGTGTAIVFVEYSILTLG